MEYFVYVLRSKKDDKFYTGFTHNLINRINEYNSGNVASTKHRIPFELVYYEVVLMKMMPCTEKNILKQHMERDLSGTDSTTF